jgi:hypothetical protein
MKSLTDSYINRQTGGPTDNQSDSGRDKPFVMKERGREINMDIRKKDKARYFCADQLKLSPVSI